MGISDSGEAVFLGLLAQFYANMNGISLRSTA